MRSDQVIARAQIQRLGHKIDSRGRDLRFDSTIVDTNAGKHEQRHQDGRLRENSKL